MPICLLVGSPIPVVVLNVGGNLHDALDVYTDGLVLSYFAYPREPLIKVISLACICIMKV